jgi:elongation factor Ts
MMECKKALVETGGDLEAAVELMRKTGLSKADKKAGRVAAEGLVRIAVSDDGRRAAIVEVNCETDFVAGGDEFGNFAQAIADGALKHAPADMDALLALDLDGASIEETRRGLIARIGENMTVRRFQLLQSEGIVASYIHGNRIGVVVCMTGGDADLAKDIAMHVAASSPMCVSEEDVPPETLAKEREILIEQARHEGKPDAIVEKMVEGRVRKYLAGITLVGQPFVKDPDVTVGKLLSQHSAQVSGFVRFEVGEGIEKKSENFAQEVMSQVQGT